MDNVALYNELVKGVEHLQITRCYILAPVVVLYYDWLLTLPLEIDRFWKRRLTGPTVLFIINRYFPIVSVIPAELVAYFTGTFSPEVCAKRVIPFIIASTVFSQALIGIILLMRTFALYERSTSIFSILFVAWITAVAVGIWGASCLVSVSPPPGEQGCLVRAPGNARYRFASAYVASLLYDSLVYALTLLRTFTLRRQRGSRSNVPLLHLIQRDGSVYFVALLGTSLLSIFLICLAEPDLRTLNVTCSHFLPVVIISRLLLNIRRERLKPRPPPHHRSDNAWATGRSTTTTTTTATTTHPNHEFSTLMTGFSNSDLMSVVIGNMGEDFEEEGSSASASSSVRSRTVTCESESEALEDGNDAIEMIEVSEVRMERERVIGWDQIWAAGING